ESRRIAARDGDCFLIAGPSLHSRLGDEEIAECWRPDGTALSTTGERLRRCVLDAAPDGGELAVAIVEVHRDPPPTLPVSGSRPPPKSWLYRPGESLPEPPPAWREGAGHSGPDSRWFAEVWHPVMATDDAAPGD